MMGLKCVITNGDYSDGEYSVRNLNVESIEDLIKSGYTVASHGEHGKLLMDGFIAATNKKFDEAYAFMNTSHDVYEIRCAERQVKNTAHTLAYFEAHKDFDPATVIATQIDAKKKYKACKDIEDIFSKSFNDSDDVSVLNCGIQAVKMSMFHEVCALADLIEYMKYGETIYRNSTR